MRDGIDAAPLAEKIRERFSEARVTTWQEKNLRLMSALKLERIGMFLLLSVVVLIATFNIFSMISLLAIGKSRETALLSSLGLSRREIHNIYLKIGFVMGFAGAVVGVGLGLAVLKWIQSHPLPLPPAYYLETLPSKIDPVIVVVLLVAAPLVAGLAALWPSLRATSLTPADLLRST
jgi:lipoprotein-releasing system permease protein